MFLLNYLIAAFFILLSGLFSGLNLGLLSLTVSDLKRKAELGNKAAKRVLPLRKKGNQLLTTLLLGNVAVNAALSIFLADITTGIIGGLVSTVLIVIFGEIIPQAFVSRHALWVGSVTAPITRFYLFLFYPVAYPIGKILDKLLGDELPTVFSHEELQAIISEHENNPNSKIDADEEDIIIGALTFSEKSVEDVMTPRSVVYMLEGSTKLSKSLFEEIKENNFTRVPVYDETIDKVSGLLYVKDLIGVTAPKTVNDFVRTDNLLIVKEEDKLDKVFNRFLKKRAQMACVFNDFGEFQGVVTLEDVIEEIIQKEVFDEADGPEDPRDIAKRNAKEIEKAAA